MGIAFGKNLSKRHKYLSHLNKLDAQVIHNSLFSGKIHVQHDNANSHVAKIVREKIENLTESCYPIHRIHQTQHPLITTFSLSNHMRGRKFKDEDDLQTFNKKANFRHFLIRSPKSSTPVAFLIRLDAVVRLY